MIGNGQKKDIKKIGITVLLLACVLCGTVQLIKKGIEKQEIATDSSGFLVAFFTEQMEKAFFVLPMYLNANEGQRATETEVEQLLLSQFPFYQYSFLREEDTLENEDEYMARIIRQEEGVDEDFKNIEEEKLDYGEDALHIENSILQKMQRENSLHNNDLEGMEQENANERENLYDNDDFLKDEMFVAAGYPAYSYDWSEEWNYESLVSNFYAVDQSTWLDEEYLDLDSLLEEDLSVDKTIEGPQILIYHTHSKEAFADSTQGDTSTTIIGAGEKLASLLQTEYGFRVLHHQAEYDTERSEAYSVALPEIEKLLAQNPGIARKVYLKAYRYNMHLKPKSMLIELGAQNNTVEEIMNACDPLAHILAIVLDEML